MKSNIVAEDFFLPSTKGPIEHLITAYNTERERIESIAKLMQEERTKKTISYFTNGYQRQERVHMCGRTNLFDIEYAMAAINAEYWSRALELTDVLHYMPSKRRSEWHDSITEMKTPDFEADTVFDTISSLMNQRMDFLAEMVDGIFTGLSGQHITNRPEGFGKRMIIDCVCDMYSDYGSRKVGLIHDMRCVIAKFRGLDTPKHYTTNTAIKTFQEQTGIWHMMDAGAFRIRVYKKGTAHIEINPEIAYRLNQILAYLHPMAIPEPHRRKPKSKSTIKEFQLIQNPIPFAVLTEIADANYQSANSGYFPQSLDFGFSWQKKDKHLRQAVIKVLEAIGGTPVSNSNIGFDYDASKIINELVISGVIPDQKSHQFYPTPEALALKAIKLASISKEDTVLEPSAGQGGIAIHLPVGQTTCVEINQLNCKVLEAKGLNVVHTDFLTWDRSQKFDKIILNPPFSQGRALAHMEKAAQHLKPGGMIVAILPASFHGKDLLPGMDISWSGIRENEFAGTSIKVTLVIAKKSL